MLNNPTAILFSSDGYEITVKNGDALTSSNSAMLMTGSDGTNARFLTLENTTPSGSEYALVVRNIPSGTQTVSGTVTANAGTGTFAVSAASLPLPTGAATETTLSSINTKIPALGQALMAASTPVVLASNQSAITVAQATAGNLNATVVGTVTANAGTGTFAISAASLPLPTGAATETTLSSINTKTPALGQAAMVASMPVVIASNQTAITVAQATAANLNATVTGTVTSNIGTTNGLALDASLTSISAKFGSLGQKAMAGSAPVVLASDQAAIPVTQSGTWSNRLTDGTNTAAVKAASTAAVAADPALVVAISPNNSITTSMAKATTGTNSTVAYTTTSTTLKASNANRLGIFITNDTNRILYVSFTATASTTAYTVRIPANGGMYESSLPQYTGIITGIWASGGSGTGAVITELT